jgi:choloylglycine hydrolase
VPKRGPGYKDFWPFAPGKKPSPRLEWTSRYGSITYNVFGREFPDGGMNEAGLYVGEMTLLGTIYPTAPGLARLYHHAWIQYLLDGFATVPEALDSLSRVVPEGHCQWHFFVADREGRAAAIEFIDGATVVHAGETLPWKLLTNSTYAAGLDLLPQFEGFGGSRKLELTADCRPDLRFVTAATMLRDIEADPAGPTVELAFAVLQAMWCGVNRFSLVFDPLALRMYVTTYRSRVRRWVDFASFDFSCAVPAGCLDIHRPIGGDAAGAFVPLTDEVNRALLREYFRGIDAGFWGNLAWKPAMVRGLQAWQRTATCPP